MFDDDIYIFNESVNPFGIEVIKRLDFGLKLIDIILVPVLTCFLLMCRY